MIITSLLDTDLYKFTMQQLVFHFFSDAKAEYRLFYRMKGIDLRPHQAEIIDEIKQFCALRFQKEEINYLASLSYFKSDYLSALKNYQPHSDWIQLTSNDQLNITIYGTWFETILLEVPLLAILSEVYNRHHTKSQFDFAMGRQYLHEKIKLVEKNPHRSHFKFSDFGTRRRFSFAWQNEIVGTLKKELIDCFMGTSNVLLAKKHALQPIGTMAHEYLQACQVLAPSLRESQHYALEIWLKEYGHQLGISLSDVYNLKSFLRDFDKQLAQAYQGVRYDSGDPFIWAEKVIAHYKKLEIDPKQKMLVFSNKMTFPLSLELCKRFSKEIKTHFGIGTNLTNDVGIPAMDIVIKMTGCNNQPVAKLTDSPEKQVCTDQALLAKLKKLFG